MGDFYHKVAAPKCSPLQSLFSGLSSHLHLLHTTRSSQSTSLSDYTSVSLFFSCHKVPHFSLRNATSISMIYPNPPLCRTLSCSHISSWLRNIQWEDAVFCSQRKLPYNPLHQLIQLQRWCCWILCFLHSCWSAAPLPHCSDDLKLYSNF